MDENGHDLNTIDLKFHISNFCYSMGIMWCAHEFVRYMNIKRYLTLYTQDVSRREGKTIEFLSVSRVFISKLVNESLKENPNLCKLGTK